MSEEIDKHVFRKYEVQSKLGKGVRSPTYPSPPRIQRAALRPTRRPLSSSTDLSTARAQCLGWAVALPC